MTTNLNKQKNCSVASPRIANRAWVLNVPDGTTLFDIKPEDFWIGWLWPSEAIADSSILRSSDKLMLILLSMRKFTYSEQNHAKNFYSFC